MFNTINRFLIKRGYIIKKFHHKTYDVVITSFPKSGRTWLRMLTGKFIAEYIGIKKKMNHNKLIELSTFADLFPEIPRIGYGHGGNSGYKKPKQLNPVKEHHKSLKVILFVRDPRDVLVSHYYSRTKRTKKRFFGKKPYTGSISKFIYEKKGSFDTILEFYNSWKRNKHVPKDFLLIRYEDMHANTLNELRKVINFIGLEPDEQLLKNAIEFASFSNMRKIETTESTQSVALKPGDINDKSSYKTRKGIIGDYKNHFTEEEIEFLTKKMNDTLSPLFGYK